MNIAKNIFFLVCTVFVLLLIPVLLKHDQPIFVEVPSINVQELDEIKAQEDQRAEEEKKEKEKQEKKAKQQSNTANYVDSAPLSATPSSSASSAAKPRARMSQFAACTSDEECVLVDNHPCGCLIGPRGKTAINIKYITEFNDKLQLTADTFSCPNNEPSSQGACSPSARTVCQQKFCRIVAN
jgi:chemotaxis protein histidine kinase CheA